MMDLIAALVAPAATSAAVVQIAPAAVTAPAAASTAAATDAMNYQIVTGSTIR